uniref:Uncharacterized protein n=1 Tax=Lepeophtheirus salmonis TaxID=72036 RepID=A0A0K2TK10_LEPSM
MTNFVYLRFTYSSLIVPKKYIPASSFLHLVSLFFVVLIGAK